MIEILQQWGVAGLFVGSFLAATLVPFSSDAMLVGMLLAGGNPLYCLVSATVGNWLGGLTSYAVGWAGRWEWSERWFRIKRETLERQQKHIGRYGSLLALLTWLPVVGDLFAVALGFYRVSPWRCAVYMLVGKALRFVVWTVLFYRTGAALF